MSLTFTNLHHYDENIKVVNCRFKYVYLKSHLALQIMHQNIAIMLLQLYYGKISFTALIPWRLSTTLMVVTMVVALVIIFVYLRP